MTSFYIKNTVHQQERSTLPSLIITSHCLNRFFHQPSSLHNPVRYILHIFNIVISVVAPWKLVWFVDKNVKDVVKQLCRISKDIYESQWLHHSPVLRDESWFKTKSQERVGLGWTNYSTFMDRLNCRINSKQVFYCSDHFINSSWTWCAIPLPKDQCHFPAQMDWMHATLQACW